MYAAHIALRKYGLPGMDLWEKLSGEGLVLHFHEDNAAMIQIVRTGRNPSMRYLHRVHRIAVAWMHEVFKAENILLEYTESELMAADIYTKAFNDPDKWAHACALINVVDPASIEALMCRRIDEDVDRRRNQVLVDPKLNPMMGKPDYSKQVSAVS